jgi:hypothetical protein
MFLVCEQTPETPYDFWVEICYPCQLLIFISSLFVIFHHVPDAGAALEGAGAGHLPGLVPGPQPGLRRQRQRSCHLRQHEKGQ